MQELYYKNGILPVTMEDLVVPPTATKFGPAANDPEFVAFKTNYVALRFSGTVNQEVFFDLQIAHGRKPDSSIDFHLHYSVANGGSAGQTVGWKLDYTIANIGSNFPTTATLDMTDTLDGTETVDMHMMSPVSEIDGTDILPSAILKCRLYRNAASDTFNGYAYLHSVDAHIYKDRIGGRIL